MVLVSIHPFAFRKIFLVLLALLGFSAFCFADPVLMARRYAREQSPAAIAVPRPLGLRPQLSELTKGSSVGDTAAPSEVTEPQNSFSFQPQPYVCAPDAFGDVASAVFCSTTSGD